MAIAAYFHPKGLTLDQYNEIHRRLAEIGETENAHRTHHSCFGTDGDLMVFDIWDSPEAFEAFGQKIGPIFAELGVDAGQPDVIPLHALLQTTAEIRTW